MMRSGLDQFIIFGDVYRRDNIDRTHYPAFHQMEAVRLFTGEQLFNIENEPPAVQSRPCYQLFEKHRDTERLPTKQECHTNECARALEANLKNTLVAMAHNLFGDKVKFRWVDCYFPFTHPSWELEVWHNDDWLETLGCGVMEQKLLDNVGAGHKVGWAFGLGLERLAMHLYQIPDIRLFWSTDTGFLSQFATDDPNEKIIYKPVSKCPQCVNDISFWLPDDSNSLHPYSPTDFYDVVRSIGGDLVEQVTLFDEFYHPKERRTSHAYRIVYRHMDRPLMQEEVNGVHAQIEQAVVQQLKGRIR